MNEQPIVVGCYLSSDEDFGNLGFRTLGCLTSKDEERETWTAESLRVSARCETSVFQQVGAGRKTSAVHVYIGYTIVVSDVNRRQQVSFG